MNIRSLMCVALLMMTPVPTPAMERSSANVTAVTTPAVRAPVTPPVNRTSANSVTVKTGRARPGLWLLSDADTKIWLFGTVHVLPENYRWQNKVIRAAANEAEALVLEIDPTEMESQESGMLLLSLGIQDGLPPVKDRVPEELRDDLGEMIAQSKVPEPFFNKMESWAAAFTLVGVQFEKLGLKKDSGVEDQLTQQFRGAKKPVTGLETTAQQLGYFDGLTEDSQRAFLVSMLTDGPEIQAEFDQMLADWSAGDEAKIAVSFKEEAGLNDELRRVLLHDRNARWTDWLIKRLDAPGAIMVAVGAGHLAGDESVQSMLKQRGFTTKRVQ